MFQLEESLTGFFHISELFVASCSHIKIVRGEGSGLRKVFGVEGTPTEPYAVSLSKESLISDFSSWGIAQDGTVGPPGFLSLGSSVKQDIERDPSPAVPYLCHIKQYGSDSEDDIMLFNLPQAFPLF